MCYTRSVERQRLFQESERRRLAAEGLAEVGRLISQSLDVMEVADRITESVRNLLGVTNSALFEARLENTCSRSRRRPTLSSPSSMTFSISRRSRRASSSSIPSISCCAIVWATP